MRASICRTDVRADKRPEKGPAGGILRRGFFVRRPNVSGVGQAGRPAVSTCCNNVSWPIRPAHPHDMPVQRPIGVGRRRQSLLRSALLAGAAALLLPSAALAAEDAVAETGDAAT